MTKSRHTVSVMNMNMMTDENIALFKLFLLNSCYIPGTEVVNVFSYCHVNHRYSINICEMNKLIYNV